LEVALVLEQVLLLLEEVLKQIPLLEKVPKQVLKQVLLLEKLPKQVPLLEVPKGVNLGEGL
jgi:hypothetical protein